MSKYLLPTLLFSLFIISSIPLIHAQVFCSELPGSLVNNCELENDFIGAALIPFDYLLGGHLSVAFWGIITLATYLKYHSAILAATVGVTVLALGTFVLQESIIVAVTLMLGTTIGIGFYYIIFRVPRTGD